LLYQSLSGVISMVIVFEFSCAISLAQCMAFLYVFCSMWMSKSYVFPFMCEDLSFRTKDKIPRVWLIILNNLYGARYR
jgi:hypothetical protein